MKTRITGLRESFFKLLRENEQLLPEKRVPNADWKIDLGVILGVYFFVDFL